MSNLKPRLVKLEVAGTAQAPPIFFTWRGPDDDSALQVLRDEARDTGAILFATYYEPIPEDAKTNLLKGKRHEPETTH